MRSQMGSKLSDALLNSDGRYAGGVRWGFVAHSIVAFGSRLATLVAVWQMPPCVQARSR